MNMRQRQDLQRVAERASEWLERLAEDGSAQTRAAFDAWMMESPVHVREFLNVAAIDRELEGVDQERQLPVETALRRENDPLVPKSISLLPFGRKGTKKGREIQTKWRWAAGIAALAVTTTLILFSQRISGWREYATAVGEQSTVKLVDGSMVNLNTDSRLEVKFNGKQRQLRLARGEALFTVARNAQRPFIVRSGDAVIQAVGTQFNVYRRESRTVVSVIEGAVKVQEQDRSVIRAGEQVAVNNKGSVIATARPDLTAAIAWRERRLVFNGSSLQEIATEFNRYNTAPRIRIVGAELRQREFTGVLDADKPESLMRFLSKESDVAFERSADELLVKIR